MAVAQQSPVTPIHIFFIRQSCTRQAENRRRKQNDALRSRVTVLGVTDIGVAGSFFPDSRVPCTTALCSACSKLGNQCRHSNFGQKWGENYKIIFQSCKMSSSHKRHKPSMSAPFLPLHIPHVLLCHWCHFTDQNSPWHASSHSVKNFPAFPWTRKNVFRRKPPLFLHWASWLVHII
jgi:hypothetical protein